MYCSWPGRVGDDELAPLGREVAVGDVDRDALLALGGQAVEQQREVELVALRCRPVFESRFERGELVVEDQLGLVEQPADQRALAVVDAAAGDEAQQALVLVRAQVGVDVLGRERRRGASEVALLLLLLHRAALVVVDHAALALRGARQQHLPMIAGSVSASLSIAPVSG